MAILQISGSITVIVLEVNKNKHVNGWKQIFRIARKLSAPLVEPESLNLEVMGSCSCWVPIVGTNKEVHESPE